METDRLTLVELCTDDWGFVLQLLNDPSYIANIRDSGVRTEAEARKYIQDTYQASYRKHGFGLLGMKLRSTGGLIGICGLVKRDAFDDPDLGFAVLPDAQSKGYTFEAATAVIIHAKTALKLPRLLAVIAEGNLRSIRLVERLGFRFSSKVRLVENGPDLNLYQATFPAD